MAADLGNVTLPLGPPVTSFADRPDHNWLSMYDAHGDPAYVEAVLTAVVGSATFGAIGNTDTTLAIGRAALTEAPDHKTLGRADRHSRRPGTPSSRNRVADLRRSTLLGS